MTPTSKVVGDLALFVVSGGIDWDELRERPQEYDLPGSVLGFLRGELGEPAGGLPQPFAERALRAAAKKADDGGAAAPREAEDGAAGAGHAVADAPGPWPSPARPAARRSPHASSPAPRRTARRRSRPTATCR